MTEIYMTGVHAYLDHLSDAYLVFAIDVATESERGRQTNPRIHESSTLSIRALYRPASRVLRRTPGRARFSDARARSETVHSGYVVR